MLSKKKFTEERQTRKLKIIKIALAVSCISIFFCALFQSVELLIYCGRDFRVSYAFDAKTEQLIMTIIELLLAIAGLIGIFLHKGPVYFVGVSFLLCTIMVIHFIDFLMGIILLYYGQGIEKFLKRQYDLYNKGYALSISKIDGIHRCNECCGINGPQEGAVTTQTGLIPSCCPKESDCTLDNAYKEGCAKKLHGYKSRFITFHVVSIIVVFFEIFTYRAFLMVFV